MPSYGVNVAKGSAQPVWYGDPTNPVPFTMANTSTGTANVWVGENNSVGPNNPNNSTEIGPGGYVSYDGSQPVYYATADAANATIQILPGVTSFFLPTTLSNIGGVSTFVQPTQPPVTSAPGSLWFDTSNESLWILQSGVWTQQAFNAAQILTAGTIVAGLIAAGTVFAGIVNGTLIQGASFEQTNSFGAVLWTALTNGDMLWYVNTGSATQGYLDFTVSAMGGTDQFGNDYVPGLVSYFKSGSTYFAAGIYQGNINFANATSNAGPWNTYTSLEPDPTTGLLAYFDNAGNYFALGTAFVRTTATININSTSPIVIVSYPNIEAISYKVRIHIVWLGGSTAASAVIGLDGSATVSNMLGTLAHARGSTLSFSNVGIVNQNSAIGNQTYPFNAGELETYEFEGIITFSAGGTFNVRGQEATAGDNFLIATFSYMELTPIV